jgi:hypothetical protein
MCGQKSERSGLNAELAIVALQRIKLRPVQCLECNLNRNKTENNHECSSVGLGDFRPRASGASSRRAAIIRQRSLLYEDLRGYVLRE